MCQKFLIYAVKKHLTHGKRKIGRVKEAYICACTECRYKLYSEDPLSTVCVIHRRRQLDK